MSKRKALNESQIDEINESLQDTNDSLPNIADEVDENDEAFVETFPAEMNDLEAASQDNITAAHIDSVEVRLLLFLLVMMTHAIFLHCRVRLKSKD